MIEGASSQYDSYADWGTRQAKADWEWIDEQLRQFAATHDGVTWGRTGFDGVLHAIQWRSNGPRKYVAIRPSDDGSSFSLAAAADNEAGVARFLNREFAKGDFHRNALTHVEELFDVIDAWTLDDLRSDSVAREST